MKQNDLVFEKYNSFVNQDHSNKISFKILLDLEKQRIDRIEKEFKNNEPLNYEFIKLSRFVLDDIYNSCIYKTLVNKRDVDQLNESQNLLQSYNELPFIIYQRVWDGVRIELKNVLLNTFNLKNLIRYSSQNSKYEENYYTKRKYKRFDKLRYIYKFFCNIDLNQLEALKRIIEDLKELIYAFILKSTNSNSIDIETKRRYYNELNKYWINLVSRAYEDALLYFIFEAKLKHLDRKKKLYIFNKKDKNYD